MNISNDTSNDFVKHPCGICNKTVGKRQKYIICHLCKNIIHIKCNEINEKDYLKIKKEELEMFCIKCYKEITPFYPSGNSNNDLKNCSSPFLRNIVNLIQEPMSSNMDKSNDEILNTNIPPINCIDLDIDDFDHTNDDNKLSLFHLNIASLGRHKDELENVLARLNFKFDIIGISETKIKKNHAPIFDISLTGYIHYLTPTELECGGTMIYVSDNLTSKPRKDLDSLFYKSKELESSFIEIVCPNKKNIIIGCIYKHPHMDTGDFNTNFLQPLLEKISAENKINFILGDFNIDLLKIENEPDVTSFFDTIASNLLIPFIINPTRVTPLTKTIIDNIFSDSLYFKESISGNLRSFISDHYAQFLIIPLKAKTIHQKQNVFKRDLTNFNKNKLIDELNEIDWTTEIDILSEDINKSFILLETKINDIIEKHMPLKKLTKKEIKLKQKPWITKEIRNLITRRNKTYKKFLKSKTKESKDQIYKTYKVIRNKIVALCRTSKKAYYQKFFMENSNNAKKTWQGIKSIINVKPNQKIVPTSLIIDNEISTDPINIANTFNKYFISIARILQAEIYPTNQDFSAYLKNRNEHNFFISPTEKEEIIKIIDETLVLIKLQVPIVSHLIY